MHRNRFDRLNPAGTILPRRSRLQTQIRTQISQMDTTCKHPKVRVVAREEDVEYVECLDCGQVFDSNEFRDMEIEEEVLQEPDED
jgi:Zn ribbon nucleic-acid-binding protein